MNNDAIEGWEAEADKLERMAALLERVGVNNGYGWNAYTVASEVSRLKSEARRYRNVALSMHMSTETGKTYCSCTIPPHELVANHAHNGFVGW